MRIVSCLLLLSLSCGASLNGAAQPAVSKATAKQTVERFFALLKGQQYAQLYDFLPSQLQQQMTREQMTLSLKRLDGFLVIERMQLGRVQEKGDYAVIDTTIFGKLKQPLKLQGPDKPAITEGRVATQQYLFKENGQWKVVSADDRARNFFVKRNPQFNEQFQLTKPQLAFKQDGKWQSLMPPNRRGAQ